MDNTSGLQFCPLAVTLQGSNTDKIFKAIPN